MNHNYRIVFFITFFFSSACVCSGQTLAQCQSINKEVIYKMAEVPPKPVGGLEAFYEYTEENIERPKEALVKGVKGNVFVQFVVETDGTLSNIKIIKGIGAGCDEVVVNCLKNAPKWIPGKQNGETVRVQKTLSIQVR